MLAGYENDGRVGSSGPGGSVQSSALQGLVCILTSVGREASGHRREKGFHGNQGACCGLVLCSGTRLSLCSDTGVF